jgi:drug/metabolite transporter (DMT)-like permease
MPTGRPDRRTLLAFATAVVFGGANFVAVRFSNRELAPFYGAMLRFGLAAIVLLAIALARRISLPGGRVLAMAMGYGLLSFAAAYALTYWGLVRASAGLGAVLVASAPLLTMLLAFAHRMEPLRWRGIIGALVALAGTVILTQAKVNAGVPVLSVLALVGTAVCIAESTIILKRFPTIHPVALNAIAMLVGAIVLGLLSAISGEPWVLPARPSTWLALAYMVPIGSVTLFLLLVYIVRRWTASASSYVTVMFPVVSISLGALLAGEAISSSLLLGALLVLLGVYVGALSGTRATPVGPVTPPS